jgi:hypothetical protein
MVDVSRLTFMVWLTISMASCGSNPSSGGDVGSNPDAASGNDGATASLDAPRVVTYQDVKPIFASKCVPCHLPGGQGQLFHTLADSYASANKASSDCDGKKVGECTIVLVKSGFMPLDKKCTGDPSKDSANPACLTAEEQLRLEAWIAGGLLEK